MINVKIIADSIWRGRNIRVTTFELEYPRYAHAELMTHRVFSRNAASSRAIPIEKMIDQVLQNTVMPIWTQNQKGMQGKRITNGMAIHALNDIWLRSARSAVLAAQELEAAGAHKQNTNRILEPYQHIKTIVTASEWDNWFNLRYHEDAMPEIYELAMAMKAALATNRPAEKGNHDWHLPYADDVRKLEDAKMVSASCCAQVSYRTNDDSLEKAQSIYARLVGAEVLHASPFEHQCRLALPMERTGNLRHLRQLRQDIEECRPQPQSSLSTQMAPGTGETPRTVSSGGSSTMAQAGSQSPVLPQSD